MTSIEYAAGFFDGEGAIRSNDTRCYINCQQNDRRPLDEIAQLLGGKVYGPYRRIGRLSQNDYYVWKAHGAKAREIAALLAPHCILKRDALLSLTTWQRGGSIEA